MAYQIEEGEPFHQGINRIGREEQKATLESLSTNKDLHKGVHQARKHLKKLRAIFRLIRDHLGEKDFKTANTYYRDIGRDLSAIRDITSQMEICSKLQKVYAPQIGDEGFQKLLQLLDKQRKKIQKQKVNSALFKEEIARIKQDKTRFEPSEKNPPSMEKVLKSLVRVYKRGLRGFQKAQVCPQTEPMHDWRKRVKYLWHQFQLLKPAWPELFLAYENALKSLADALGDYHDLALLQENLPHIKQDLPTGFANKLIKVAAREKQQCLEQSIQLGKNLYAERPKAFRRRMASVIVSFFSRSEP